jgi:hypothetical protein
VAGNVTEFDGDLGLVIGAGGGSLTLFDAVRAHGGQARELLRDRRQPVGREGLRLAKLVLQKPGVDKIAVMMSIVSNTAVDIVARGVIKACLELGTTRRRRSRSSASPGRGRRRASRSSRSTASSTRIAGVVPERRRQGWRWPDEHPRRRRDDLHRPGHHRPRGGQPHARVPGLRRRGEDRRRGDPGRLGREVHGVPSSTRSPRPSSTTAARSTAPSSPSRPPSPRTR